MDQVQTSQDATTQDTTIQGGSDVAGPSRQEFSALQEEITAIGRILRDPTRLRDLVADPERTHTARASTFFGCGQPWERQRSRAQSEDDEQEERGQANNNAGASNADDATRTGLKTARRQTRDPRHLFEHLTEQLHELKTEGRLKPRELHEVKVLKAIFDAEDISEAQTLINNRLSEIYIAISRSWAEAKVYQRRDVDKLLGLPPPAQTVVVKQQAAPSKRGSKWKAAGTKPAYKKK
jgi:hypothetical protein